jgi:hypothetical protein
MNPLIHLFTPEHGADIDRKYSGINLSQQSNPKSWNYAGEDIFYLQEF